MGCKRQYPIRDLKPTSHYTMITSQFVPGWLTENTKIMLIELQAPACDVGAGGRLTC